MIAALVLGLDDEGTPQGCDLSSQARAGDSAADDNDVKSLHPGAGYEFETAAV
jgi:hypothetical protein